MATNMDKALYQAPQGLADLEGGQEVDIGMDDGLPAEDGIGLMIELPDGGVEVTLGIDIKDADEEEFEQNLAEVLDESVLQSLADELIELVDADTNARKDWADTYVKGLEVLGFKYEERTEPWNDACGVYSTVLAEAAIRFQAEAMSETFPPDGPVKTKIVGEFTKEKEDAAERVRSDMNYELTEVMVEYRSEHERMLYSLGLAGSAFKKVYFDPNLNRQVSIYIPAEDVIIPYGASHIQSAERITHVMRKTENEIKKLQAAGFYIDCDLGEPQSFFSDIEKKKAEEGGYELTSDDRFTLYEIHADLIIDGLDDVELVEENGIDEEDGVSEEDGGSSAKNSKNQGDDGEPIQVAKPYVITIERGTQKILAIRRNWDPEDELKLRRNHFVHYVYVPGFGFYGLGLIHIIGGYARAGTSLIRQLVDAGTLSNLPGGLKSRGLRVKGDDTPIGPGEFRDVDVPSGAIKDNIMTLPYKEPSQVLLALLNQITEEGRRLGAISDMNISDMSAQAPVGTTLALLERTLKPMAAVQARVHYAMKLEFKLLKELIAEYAPIDYEYVPERGAASARQADYAMVEVIPVSDPNASTMAQKFMQMQAVMQMSQGAPQIYDLPYLHRQAIEVLGIKNADKIVPIPDDAKPKDPVSENMNALTGTPLKAFIYQDHDAHIATHTSFIQDPMIAQTIGQNPQAQQIMAAIQAHIAEHLGFAYRKQIEDKLGVALPPPDQELPEEIEVQLARLVADAGKQVAQDHAQAAAAQQAQQQAQDPMMQLQQAELQIKAQELQRKMQKDQADTQIAAARLQLDKQKADLEVTKERMRTVAKNQQDQAKNKLDALKVLAQPKGRNPNNR
ncbi:MAG: hypothetical protein EBR82_31070 [Caulobacteraceae bacterium]|nr:hypothetical protein [Caulobacteraceae bacterium]